ncbi:hypothetical protein DICPUDRAFT_28467 [Dictyostelium purpureum]|uniref:Sister chromatid cohesion protein DCC1 n=1 Tax=Dictyostelium purpureum TaxID=5786 RepID=F0ZC04_DICPU|nr:uncharacterized protein DICPUDRAFT_28467 [Dictyostelium purpureum]EGC38577.1 hypothetical protein DICPUDRAFT_28467 [Dictyostelium purpureum]|eukprot:XP_003284948.1 hypothetical protein DICPUDRAFT_28467 [Dictyostelium purpureum]
MTPNNDDSINVKTIKFSNEYPSNKYKFLEANQEILDELKKNKKLVIKGGLNEDAVLCTEDKTFAIRAGHTSNSMLLITKDNENIVSTLQYHLELTEIQPKLNPLRDLFLERSIKTSDDLDNNIQDADEDDENGENNKKRIIGLTYKEIINNTQSSEKEIQQFLQKLNTLCYNDKYFIFSESYEFKILELILTEITINNWSLENIPIEKCKDNINAPKAIIEHCLKLYRKPQENANDEGGSCSLDLNKICIFRAKQILNVSIKSNMRFEEFMETWKDSLPVNVTPNFSMLKGIAILITVGKDKQVKYINESTLSSNPKQRFKELFTISARWTIDDIEPFIRSTIPPGNSLEQFILTYSRPITTPTGERMLATRF